MIEEIVEALKMVSKNEKLQDEPKNKTKKKTKNNPSVKDEQLKQLHDEFSWLVTDIGVKEPFNRSQIYDLE